MPRNNIKSFTLVELLIVIAILAVLAAAVVVVLNPAELLAQARDSQRVTDMKTVKDAIDLFIVDNPAASQGTAQMVYVSIPDTSSTCANITSLPSLPVGWAYRCVTTANVRNIDGTGWIPLNFTTVKGGSPIPYLPIDPTNDASQGKYYTYVAGGSYIVTAFLESEKSLHASAVSDGGVDPSRLEVGNDLSLWKAPSGIVGLWKLDGISGTSITNGQTTGFADSASTWNGTARNANGAGMSFIPGKFETAVDFDGVDDHVELPNDIGLGSSELSVTVWVKYDAFGVVNSSRPYVSDWNTWTPGAQRGFILRTYGVDAAPSFWIADGVNFYSIASSENLNLGQWYNITGVFKANSIYKIYVNGVERGSYGTPPAQYVKETATPIYIGRGGINSGYFDGALDNVIIYRRALSAQEVMSIYKAGK